jgi:hypothetical protein
MKKFILLIITLIGFLSWQACQYEWVEPAQIVIPEVVSFSANVIPIFNGGCNASGCHATGGTAPDLTPANAYASLFANNLVDKATPENSKFYKEVKTGGGMNKYTKPGDSDMILKWIQQGAQNN